MIGALTTHDDSFDDIIERWLVAILCIDNAGIEMIGH